MSHKKLLKLISINSDKYNNFPYFYGFNFPIYGLEHFKINPQAKKHENM